MRRLLRFRFSRAMIAIFAISWLLPGAMALADESAPAPRPKGGFHRHVDHGAAKPTDHGTAKPADKDDAKPADRDAAKPADSGDAKPADRGDAKPADQDAAKPAAEPAPTGPRKLRFQFRFQPWKDVLDWFAQQADLSLVMDSPPQGTFNYSDNREYTPAEAIDLLNSVLLTKGYTLVRRDRMLMLINLEDGIPPNLVSTVALEALDSKGEFELVSVLFNLEKLKPEEAELEVKRLLGPQGSVVALAKSRQLFVTETAGRLRAIRAVIARIEGPEGSTTSGLQVFELKFARSEDVLPIVRQLLEIPEDKASAADGSIRIAAEPGSSRLMVSGRPEKVARAADILKGLDVPTPGSDGTARLSGTPQLEVYPVAGTDPASALAVLQTLLTGLPDVRLALDPKTNSLVAMARPAQHATIRAALTQLQRDGQRVDVIRLSRVDPQTAVLSITKLFGSSEAGKGTAPQVDADPVSRQLMIRGTETQITQIRELLEKMGENLTPGAGPIQSGRVRTLPMTSSEARSIVDRIQKIWPTIRPNKIRVVSPSAMKSGAASGDAEPPGDLPPELLNRLRELKSSGEPAKRDSGTGEMPPEPKPAPSEPIKPSAANEHSADLPHGARIIYVGEQSPAKTSPPSDPSAPIIVMPGPDGLVIASEDIEALDEFQRLLNMLSEASSPGGREITVFYLKHAKAAALTETLEQIFSGGSTVPAASPTGGPPGQPPTGNPSDPRNFPGAIGRLGIGNKGFATGPVKIIPDQRLNALLVQANRTDLDNMEQVLKILDLKESPEDIAVAPKPRMIPVKNTRAQEVAEVVKQVYADRMVESTSANRQPMMPWFMMGRRQQTPTKPGDDVAKIAVGVDSRTNSLIVAATDPLFEEVKQLVDQLDVAAAEQEQTVRVVALHRTSASAVEEALSAIAGDSIEMNRTGAAAGAGSQSTPNAPSTGQPRSSFRRMRSGASAQPPPSQQQPPAFQPGMNPPPQQQGFSGGRRSPRSHRSPSSQ